MNKKILLGLFVFTLLFQGCGSQTKMQDGFYSAEMSGYSHGWKEYVCIMVKDGKIVYTEFNAKDLSGYIKAWDNAYMQNMASVAGTYPNEYTRYYAAQLTEKQDSSNLDALTGATSSGTNFKKLTDAVIEQSMAGNPDTRIVEMEE